MGAVGSAARCDRVPRRTERGLRCRDPARWSGDRNVSDAADRWRSQRFPHQGRNDARRGARGARDPAWTARQVIDGRGPEATREGSDGAPTAGRSAMVATDVFADQIAKEFILNKNREASKWPTQWKPPKRTR